MFKLSIKDFLNYPRSYNLENLKELNHNIVLEIDLYSIIKVKMNNKEYYACFSYSTIDSYDNCVHPFILKTDYDSFMVDFKNFLYWKLI